MIPGLAVHAPKFILIAEQMKKENVTLVYAARDETHNEAIVLLSELKR